MLDILYSIWDLITSAVQFVVDLFSSLINLLILLYQSLGYLVSYIFIVPGELLIFGLVFIFIFIFNRLSFGSNGGDSK